MAIEDLDLEFEDEDEDKSDALAVDVDLSFSASPETASAPSNKKVVGNNSSLPSNNASTSKVRTSAAKTAARSAAKPTAKPTQTPKARAAGNVTNIAEQRAAKSAVAQKPQVRQTSQQVQSPVQAPVASDDIQYELDLLHSEIAQLKEQLEVVKNQSDLKVAVAEAKSEFMIEYITNAKLLDHQVNQIMQRIHKKVPALKNEVLTVKKYLNEFLQKSSKKK